MIHRWDFNNDGFLDLLVGQSHNQVDNEDAFIYWGSNSGYSDRRLTRLPTLMAKAVVAADFNGDGFVDLAFANKGIEGGKRFGYTVNLESYIYWNGPRGFDPDRLQKLPTISATDCAAGDSNGDGRPELVFVNHNKEHSSVSIF
ncbi:MAG: VCBS repeat-containing protein [Verrucomicrobia bacterium]|nr:VCBS repeat-containing protein [Verrucomicrobiota bacterium]